MKLWQLFIVFMLSVPLYLFAAEPTQNSTNTTQSQAVVQPQGAMNTNQSTVNQNTNAQQNTATQGRSTQQSTAAQNPNAQQGTVAQGRSAQQSTAAQNPNVQQGTAAQDTTQNPNLDATANSAPTPTATPENDPANQPLQEQVEKKDIKDFANSQDGAKDFVKNLLEIVYSELPTKANNQEVFTYLSEITSEYFAFTYMSKWTIGRDTIKDVPVEQQEKYLALSKEFMVLLYGEIFNTYYRQYNYTLGEVETKSDTQYDVKMIVEPKVKDPKNQDTVLNIVWKVKYSTQEKRFYIINIDVNGVLLLMSQQKQFREMLKSQGGDFGKFLDLLSSKNLESKTKLGISL